MRLKRAEIFNYRSIRQATIEFGDQTRLIGGNGCGKSSVVKALELFYAPAKTTVSRDDFFGRDEANEIEIALTFHEFSDQEKETFKGHITESGELSVSRVFSANGGKNNGKYHGVQLAYPAFQAVRAAGKAAEKSEAYKALLPEHPDLDKGAKTAAAIEAAMAAWEAANPEKCQALRDDGQFFGFEGVAQGKLSSSTAFVFVPAVRDAAQDVAEGKGTPITLLMDLIVRSAIEARPEIKEFRAKVESEYQALTDPAKLTELGGLATTLSGTLSTYYPETSVELDWLQRDALKVPLPNAAIRLNDDGFSTAVDRTGHGLQRALILTLLQHLATASMKSEDVTEEMSGTPTEPDLILAIEEPEVYQHPTKQRHFARVLDLLSSGKLAGIGKRIQVIYCSHSPMFVAMEQFDQVRLMRRIKKEGQRESVPHAVSLADVATELDAAHQAEGKFSADRLRSRLHIIDIGVAEGFFSTVTVLVEGPSDRAALLAAARYLGKDLEQNEVAVVSVNGKANIDRPAAVFRGLGIPVYAVWDCDEGTNDFRPETNKALQRLFKTPEAEIVDAVDRITTNYACFRVKLEETLKAEIGAEFYRKKMDELKTKFEITKDNDAQKSPVVMFDLIVEAANAGNVPKTLVAIVEAVIALRPTPEI
ncbi:ATP-dependent endonuclease [Hyphomicrobium sp. MC1]|uniref:ATP-dependent nuclease n=1 Tax=Hyphomicrobium sp. (strain MC1) TaxID=717785 RepID=UPI000213E6C2|nr:AAA family ATPase [Hyphomicrobium sp. MC1]CCB66561.1 ATP-dependent endonuclease, OLD family protein [Hyphomicrobium sp. MC1]